MNERVDGVKKLVPLWRELLFEVTPDLEAAFRFSLWESLDSWFNRLCGEFMDENLALKCSESGWARREILSRAVVDKFLQRFAPSVRESIKSEFLVLAEKVYFEWLEVKKRLGGIVQISNEVRLGVSRELE